jgi:hypothetical protein
MGTRILQSPSVRHVRRTCRHQQLVAFSAKLIVRLVGGAALLTVGVMTVQGGPAGASCEPLEDLRDELAGADAAFVGSVAITPTSEAGGDGRIWTFAVEEWVKGEGGDTVDVVGPVLTNSDNDGFTSGRVGVLIHLRGDAPTGDPCRVVDPGLLSAAAAPAFARVTPDGDGPLAILVGGDLGSDRVVALDRDGGILGYGRGEGTVSELSVCPGSKVSVEYADDPATGSEFIARRDLSTLAVIDQVSLEWRHTGGFVGALICTSEDGTDTLAVTQSWRLDYPAVPVPGETHIREGAIMSPFPEPQLVVEGLPTARNVSLTQTVAITRDDTQLLAFDLITGQPTVLHDIAQGDCCYGSVVVSPDGSRLAVTYRSTSDIPPFHQLEVIDIATTQTVAELTMPAHSGEYIASWIDDMRLVVVSHGGDLETGAGTVRVFDADTLELRTEFTGFDHSPIGIIDELIYAITATDGNGPRLVAIPTTGGSVTEIRALESFDIASYAAVPDGGPVTPAAATAIEANPTPTTPPASIPPGQPIGGPDQAAEPTATTTPDQPDNTTPSQSDDITPTQPADTDDSGGDDTPVTVWVLGGCLLAGSLVAGLLVRRRRSQPTRTETSITTGPEDTG